LYLPKTAAIAVSSVICKGMARFCH